MFIIAIPTPLASASYPYYQISTALSSKHNISLTTVHQPSDIPYHATPSISPPGPKHATEISYWWFSANTSPSIGKLNHHARPFVNNQQQNSQFPLS